MIIYTSTGNTLLDIPVSDESYRYRAIRQGAKVYLYFSLAEHVEVPVGSYVEYEGQRYTLWRPEDFKKHGTRNFEYSLTMGDDSEWLNRVKYKHLSAIPLRLKFPLTGSPRLFLQLLIDNLNEADGGWTLGTCIEGPDRALSFNHEYCGEVLDRFADEWGTEYEFEGKTLNFGKVEYNKDAPLPLSYGKGNGFKTGVGRQNQGDRAPVTILYVQGGERNIDASTYGSSTLLLPKSQELEYEGRRYKTDADGLYITRADRELTRRSEDSLDASDIYPSRVGTVSEVIAVDAANHLYDIKDSSIPDSLDYSQCRIAGERATLIFQSGVLAGEEFDIEQTDEELTGYVHAERRFKLVPVEKEGGVIPNENRKPSVGDTYAVFNISLPAAYVCDNASKSGASWDMFREGVRCLYEKEEETFTFSGELDGIWAKSQWLTVGGKTRPGGYVLFSDPQFQPEGIAIRITGVKDYINRPHSPEIELSNTPVAGFLSSDINKIDSNEVKDEQRYTKALQFTKRRYRDAIEAQEMLEAAFDNYSKGIDPIWVRTMSLLVGDESLQFRFVSSRTNPQTVEPDFRYNDETGIFTAPALILQHLTLGIKDIKREHESSEYQYWDLEAYTSPYLGDYGKLYFYARCGKTTGKGQFLMSEEPHKMEEGDNYYFLVGLLGSQFDGIRSFVTVYGFTEILPGRITVDRIVSTDGQTYFVLDKGDGTGEIHGRIILTAGSSGLKELAEWDEVQREIEAAQATADEAVREIEETSQVLDDFQTTVNTTFKDEVIETSEAKAIEKYINLLKAEKVDADAAYSELSANPFLPTASASDLSAKKSAYDNAHTALIKAVQDAIADKRTDEEEKAAVDSAFTLYNTALSNYRTSVEAANEAIQNALKGYSDAALAEAKAAHSAANAAQDSADEAGQAVEDLGTEIKTTFRDGVLTDAEKISIEKYLNTVESTMADVRATYTKLYANPYLEGTAETGLKSAYDNLTSAYNALVDSIEAATADDAATDAEFADVNTKFDMFNSRLNSFKTAIEAANEAIQNALKGYSDAALAEAKAAHSAANAAQDSADEAGQAVEDLGTEIKTTFRDGVLTDAEKISIEKYLNTVESTMADVRATYTKLYANPYLEGTAETGLKSAYDNLTSAYNALVDSIELATDDDTATDAEFADVNTKFDTFNSRLNSFKTAIEAANEAIQTKLKELSDDADEQIRLTYDSKIENLGSQISASVTALNEFKEEVRSAGWITTAEGNQLWARKDGIISAINQSPESITISASRINLNGKVTFSMFNNSLQNIINGKADTSDLGNLATLDTVGESQLSSSVKNTINGKLDDSDVGALAYLDKVEAAQLGTTIISGGHIITSLIDTDAIFADMASIGGFTITGSMLYSNNYDSYVGNYRLYMNSSKGEIGIDNSTRVTYRLGGNYEYASGEAATFYIRRSMATTRMAPVVGAIKIKTFDNAGSDVNAAIDVEIEDGNGGSFMQFLRGGLSMRFTAKQFSNDTTGILRTCIWAGRMPTHTQVSTLSGTSTRYTVKWDSGTGLMYVE